MFVPRVFHVTLIHSLIRTPKKIRNVANELGLNKKYDNIVYISSPRLNKFFLKISHLIQVVPMKILPQNIKLPSNIPKWVKNSNFINNESLENDVRFLDTDTVNIYGYCDISKVNLCEKQFLDLFLEHKENYSK